jgi:hypothetical protein
VIRTVALGVFCLAGLGAIAVAKISNTGQPLASHEDAMHATAGNKADRLSISVSQDTLTSADKVSIVYIPLSDENRPTLTEVGRPEISSQPSVKILPRDRHDPNDVRGASVKVRSSSTKPSKKRSTEDRSKQVRQVKECRADVLGKLLRAMNLSPACAS